MKKRILEGNIFYFNGGNIEKFPFTYWLNGRWFLQIVGIYIQYKFLYTKKMWC